MVLLSRTLDPLLGVFTGALAFYLHETNPRTAPPPDQRLTELVRWKYNKRRKERDEKLKSEEENIDWQAIISEEKK